MLRILGGIASRTLPVLRQQATVLRDHGVVPPTHWEPVSGCWNLVSTSYITTSAPMMRRERCPQTKKKVYWSAKSQRHTRKKHPFFWWLRPDWNHPVDAQ